MDEKERVSSGSSSTPGTTTATFAGTGTVDSAELVCGCHEPGIEKIEVEQVLGAEMAQRVVEFDMVVPASKPDIEQIIDVYVKDVCVNSVDVIKNKVVIRGELEVKVMYVADLPNQPVHAFERKHVRFTRDIEIEGADKDMKATADVMVEFVDYDFHRHHDDRKVHITIVLKFWARVITTTEMDVFALSPVTEVGEFENLTASASSGDSASASSGLHDSVSASQTGGGDIAAISPQNVFVTDIEPTAGTSMTINGVTGTITGNSVNVRTGPGTNFPVVTKVNKGDTVIIKDQAFGWNKVVLSDGSTTGWIAGWLISTNGVPNNVKG